MQKAIDEGVDRQSVLVKIKNMIQKFPDLNVRERARIYIVCKRLTVQAYDQAGKIWKLQDKKFRSGVNKVREHRNTRFRRAALRLGLRNHRATGGVFFMSSWHNKCAEGHKAYQGQIYVDRFWRSTLQDDPDTYRAVEAYVRNHDLMTVQEVVGAPVYLITRPYCKHYMIPLDTGTVLTSSANRIRKILINKKRG